MAIHCHLCCVWCTCVRAWKWRYVCAQQGVQVHVCTRLGAINVEYFPWILGSELRTSCTLIMGHLWAPWFSVPAHLAPKESLRLVPGTLRAPEQAGAASSHMWLRSALCLGVGAMPTTDKGLLDSFLFCTGSIPVFPADSPKYILSLLLTIKKKHNKPTKYD